jgi:ribosomal protein L11 methyltransferase
MPLLQLEITLPAARAEPMEEQLFAWGACSVMLRDAGDEPILEPTLGTHPLWTQVCVQAVFTDGEAAHLAQAALQNELLTEVPRLTTLADQDWVRSGLAGLEPLHCGGALWVVPSWKPLPAVADAVCVQLDPGLAFGTGHHPTTALCLQALAERPPSGLRVLDYGCGSGILAIAMLKLGAATATAVDIDPQALLATRRNAERNGIAPGSLQVFAAPPLPVVETGQPAGTHPDPADPGPGLDCSTGTTTDEETSAPWLAQRFDVLVANILAGPLLELAPQLAALAAPGARLLLAGLLDTQAETLLAAYREAFHIEIAATREHWVLLEGWAFSGMGAPRSS